MARAKKPYDLDCWVELVERGQWFMVWQENWVPLFTWRPDFILRWPKKRLDAVHWHVAINKKPTLAKQCDFESLTYKYISYDEFWFYLLTALPDLAYRCDWERLEEETIMCMLFSQPGLILSIPEEFVTGGMWSQVLARDEKYADRCQWEKLSESDWRFVLENQPTMISHYVPHDATDWEMVFTAAPWMMSDCPVEKLSGAALCEVLEICPELASRADLSTISPQEWSTFLVRCPEFADKCDFGKFSGANWASLLSGNPGFADKCEWALLGGEDWKNLLVSQPRLAIRCDWDKLGLVDWAQLLNVHPEFGERCKMWDRFTFAIWKSWSLHHGDNLWRCPERMRKGVDRRPWFWDAVDAWHQNKENEVQVLLKSVSVPKKRNNRKLYGYRWNNVVEEGRPQDLKHWMELVKKGQWFMVMEQNWVALFWWRPETILQWPKERLRAEHWHAAIGRNPELAKYCDFASLDYMWESYDEFWTSILMMFPELSGRCDWGRLDESSRNRLIHDHPELICSVPKDCVTGEMCRDALLHDDKFAEECQWEKLSEWDWHAILEAHPEYIVHYVPGEDTDWARLATLGIDIGALCPFGELVGRQLVDVLAVHPDWSDLCDLNGLSPWDWSSLLQEQPQFADKCDFGKFSGKDWANLLWARPEFSGKCDWNKLDGDDWENLLDSQPRFSDKCDWSKLKIENWLRLMIRHPELEEHCRCWDEFDDWNWKAIAKYHGDHLWRCPEHMRKQVDRRDWFWEAADAWHAAQERKGT